MQALCAGLLVYAFHSIFEPTFQITASLYLLFWLGGMAGISGVPCKKTLPKGVVIAALLVLGVSTSGLLWWESNGITAQRHFAQGRRQEALGNWRVAYNQFMESAAIRVVDPVVYYKAAEAARRMGATKKSEQAFLEMLRLKPYFWYAHQGLGHLYGQTSQYKKALESYSREFALEPREVEGTVSALGLLLSLGRMEDLKGWLSQAQGFLPHDPILGFYKVLSQAVEHPNNTNVMALEEIGRASCRERV